MLRQVHCIPQKKSLICTSGANPNRSNLQKNRVLENFPSLLISDTFDALGAPLSSTQSRKRAPNVASHDLVWKRFFTTPSLATKYTKDHKGPSAPWGPAGSASLWTADRLLPYTCASARSSRIRIRGEVFSFLLVFEFLHWCCMSPKFKESHYEPCGMVWLLLPDDKHQHPPLQRFAARRSPREHGAATEQQSLERL